MLLWVLCRADFDIFIIDDKKYYHCICSKKYAMLLCWYYKTPLLSDFYKKWKN